MSRPVRVGIVGTSWWADAMYLPPLAGYDGCEVVACCGRNRSRAETFAARWSIPHVFTDVAAMCGSGLIDAVIVAAANAAHYPATMAALDAGLHTLCEKPLALTLAQAIEMRDRAADAGVITAVPFTYRYMPSTRYVKHLIDDGFLGRPYHLHLRYYAGYGRPGDRESGYSWRFDKGAAGSGALGDIGSHFLYLAEWFYGEVAALCARLDALVERPPLNPAGQPYEQADDTALLLLRFKNGAQGVVHASTLAYEETPFGQVHEMDFHGEGGTLRHVIDWMHRQEVRGVRAGGGPSVPMPVPDRFWGAARRDPVTDTYKDVFRVEGHMVREFVDAVAAGRPMRPDFTDGARNQQLLHAALESHRLGRWVDVA